MTKLDPANIANLKVLTEVDDSQLLPFLEKENPEIVALVLKQMDSERASGIISRLPEKLRNDVNSKLAEMN